MRISPIIRGQFIHLRSHLQDNFKMGVLHIKFWPLINLYKLRKNINLILSKKTKCPISIPQIESGNSTKRTQK